MCACICFFCSHVVSGTANVYVIWLSVWGCWWPWLLGYFCSFPSLSFLFFVHIKPRCLWRLQRASYAIFWFCVWLWRLCCAIFRPLCVSSVWPAYLEDLFTLYLVYKIFCTPPCVSGEFLCTFGFHCMECWFTNIRPTQVFRLTDFPLAFCCFPPLLVWVSWGIWQFCSFLPLG